MKHNIFLSVGLLCLLVGFGLAYGQSTVLQGAFQKSSFDSSTLKVTSRGSGNVTIDWDGGIETNLGKWNIKANENVQLQGYNFYIGDIDNLSTSSDNYLSNYFEELHITITQSSTSIVDEDLGQAYNPSKRIDFEAGKTYTLTLTGIPIEDSSSDFISNSFVQKEVAFFIQAFDTNLTDSGNSIYMESDYISGLSSEESNDAGDVEYTFGGFALLSDIAMISTTEEKISPATQGVQIEQQSSYATKNNNYGIDDLTNTIKSLVSGKITVKLSDSSLLTEGLSIEVDGSNLVITNGSETKTCTKVSSSEFSCSLPSN